MVNATVPETALESEKESEAEVSEKPPLDYMAILPWVLFGLGIVIALILLKDKTTPTNKADKMKVIATSSSKKCEKGHAMQMITGSNKCRKKPLDVKAGFLRCKACDYDLCLECDAKD